MNKTIEAFIISSLDGSKTITDNGWTGISLEPHTMDTILDSAPIRKNSTFERSHPDANNIQYYKTFQNADSVVKKFRNRSKYPILEALKIVSLTVTFDVLDEVIYDVSDDNFKDVGHNLREMEKFESDAGKFSDNSLKYSDYRNEDLTGYTDLGIQVAFEFWKKLRNNT